MATQTPLLQTRLFSLLSGALVAFAFATFASSHWAGYRESGEWSLLLFCFSEALVALFILTRREPETVSSNHFDWCVAIAGTFAPLLFRPASWGVLPLGKYAVVAGVVFQIAGLLSLNRSIAMVPAKRQLKTTGMYRFVRHPLYGSYLVVFSGYVLVNSSLHNLLVYLLTMTMIFIRTHKEEIHLQDDPVYIDYMRSVNYRLIPFIY